MPRLLIIDTILGMELYCKPSGSMVSAAPGQLTPAYTTFCPEAETMSLPLVVNGVSGQAQSAGVENRSWGKLRAATLQDKRLRMLPSCVREREERTKARTAERRRRYSRKS